MQIAAVQKRKGLIFVRNNGVGGKITLYGCREHPVRPTIWTVGSEIGPRNAAKEATERRIDFNIITALSTQTELPPSHKNV